MSLTLVRDKQRLHLALSQCLAKPALRRGAGERRRCQHVLSPLLTCLNLSPGTHRAEARLGADQKRKSIPNRPA